MNIPTDTTPLLDARGNDKSSASARRRYCILAAAVATMTLAVVASGSLTSAKNHDTHGNGRAVALQQPRDVAPQLGRSPNWFMSDPPNGEGMGRSPCTRIARLPR